MQAALSPHKLYRETVGYTFDQSIHNAAFSVAPPPTYGAFVPPQYPIPLTNEAQSTYSQSFPFIY